MLKALLSASALVAIALATPASAMSCGEDMQAQATPTQAQPGGMMCMPSQSQATAPGAQKPKMSGMCPCCRNMAGMMKPGGMQHDMPGMEMDMPKAK